jgi:uncharacterized membrane protein YuzA (DUF378 family)
VIVLLIIGGLNWFLIGVFGVDVVDYFFGSETITTRIIYIFVGLSAFYALLNFKKYL